MKEFQSKKEELKACKAKRKAADPDDRGDLDATVKKLTNELQALKDKFSKAKAEVKQAKAELQEQLKSQNKGDTPGLTAKPEPNSKQDELEIAEAEKNEASTGNFQRSFLYSDIHLISSFNSS